MEKDNKNFLYGGRIHHGENIQKYRKREGLTQKEMAKRLDISQRAYSRIEAKDTVDDNTLNEIALILNVKVEELKSPSEEESNLGLVINNFDHSSPKIDVKIAEQQTNNEYNNYSPELLEKYIEQTEELVKTKQKLEECRKNKD